MMKQIPLAIGPQPSMDFDGFVTGSNHEPLAAMRHLASMLAAVNEGTGADIDAVRPPVYLWGDTGSGKTHLLRALAGELQAAGRKLGWFESGRVQPWDFLPDWSALVFDDVDRFDADEQGAAFALFVEATTHGVPVLAAGRVPPVDLPLREDLRTRLAWGLVYAMQLPGDADTRAALRRQADDRGLILKDEMFDHLLTHFPRDLGQLSALLARIDEYSLSTTRRITLPMLRAMLGDEAAADQPESADAR
ncbi:MAG: DnaA regulatory inactivator Hda [Rubrivivax sp.]|jgi:DnaA family protein|nr:DnaA regulatory inactivator Hda [Rubrivivax sp.]